MTNGYSERQFLEAADLICSISHEFYRKGWLPATSGNFSLRLDKNCCALTASGKDKSVLSPDDIMVVDFSGQALSAGKPSAETALHLQLYRQSLSISTVLHTHSPNATVLSRVLYDRDCVSLSGYELLKALVGIDTHDIEVSIPIFENTQDIDALAEKVAEFFDRNVFDCNAYVIRGHGLYVWAENMAEASRTVEALEFLFACELEHLKCGV